MSSGGISFVTVSDDRFGRKDGKYSQTQDQVLDTIKCLGFSNIFSWKWGNIVSNDFYTKNKKILDETNPDMNGRCYKPFVILESLRSINDGDFLIYNDVSPEHWKNFSFDPAVHSLETAKHLCSSNGGILTTETVWIVDNELAPHTHENFTTERCMVRMGMQKYRHSIQHASGIIILQKNQKSIEFVSEWLKWNLIDECASLGSLDGKDSYYSDEVKAHGKIGHRHDQSISGLLVNDGNIKILKNPGGFNFYNFCRNDYNYEFIETNLGPSQYIYKNTFINNEWKYLKTPRNPDLVERSQLDPTNLR